jgi:hypothetical protein
MTHLGKLEKVELRDVWAHEARDFSSWMFKQENLDQLGTAVGIDIDPIGTESNIGRFRIDILAQEPRTGHKIIIENQLENTNHDHLGKVITYAAGLDAKYLIWVVKDVLPEHLKAIEWLNEHLDNEIYCFLVKIEVWKIGDSQAAPHFEVVSAKNDWAVSLKRTADDSELTPAQVGQLEFWTYLQGYIQNKDSNIKLQTPRPRRYYNISIGSALANIVLVLSPQKNTFACNFYISNDKQFLAFLKGHESAIRAALGPDMDWFDANVASGIYVEREVDDALDKRQQEDFANWCYQKMQLFKNTLTPYMNLYKAS